MIRAALILAGLTLPAALAAQDAPPPDAAKPVQDCSAHKFETLVERVVDGETRQSRVQLCGNKGQTDAQWIATLEDAVAKLNANADMPPESRTQIIAAITAEIARLRAPPASVAAPALTPRPVPRPRDLRDEYGSVPPLPPPAPVRPVAVPPATLSQGVSAAQVPAAPLVAAPVLSFDCYVPGEISGPAPCIDFQRETLITVRARSDVPAGAELHFERNGSDRATVAIGPLPAGRSKRLPLPAGVCRGVGDGRLSIVTWVGGRPARSEGPFTLRCS